MLFHEYVCYCKGKPPLIILFFLYRFRYASTVVDHEVWQARREERQRIEMENTLPREQRKISRRLRWSATKDRRKFVFNFFFKLCLLFSISGLYFVFQK